MDKHLYYEVQFSGLLSTMMEIFYILLVVGVIYCMIKKNFFLIFVYLSALGLDCGVQSLSLQHVEA